MIPRHIKKSTDLETTHEAICEGFLKQAAAKVDKAKPYVEEARRLAEALAETRSFEDYFDIPSLRDSLLASIGFSDKALNILSNQELSSVLKEIFGKLYKGSKDEFKTEVIYRFLLTKGDSLGGRMRNITGSNAQVQFSSAITDVLKTKGTHFEIETAKGRNKIKAIRWNEHLLVFDRTPKLIGKNIDVIVLNSKQDIPIQLALEKPELYLACGELKGGIDPAGADEHWKTARSALERIRYQFKKKTPALFFIGAAIEREMAKEIFRELKKGRLTHAANLTVPKQVEDLVAWLLSI